jgi:phage FluMu gp28-like protein
MSDLKTVLLSYQWKWISDLSPVKVYEKSRRIGATWAEAAAAALNASKRSGCDWWYIGYNKEMALEFIEEAARWARKVAKAAAAIEEIALADENKNILAYRVRFASGNKIVALSSRPSNLRGKDGVVIIDEAALHPDLDGLLKAALAYEVWGGRIHIISTHLGADNPFNELVTESAPAAIPTRCIAP